MIAAGTVSAVRAQVAPTEVPASITTPDRVQTRSGTLIFDDGYPVGDTAEMIRDELDYIHAIDSFMNSIQGVSLIALRNGFADVGVEDGDFLISPKLLDSRSLFLTANADTIQSIRHPGAAIAGTNEELKTGPA